jgi:hypothetical protein
MAKRKKGPEALLVQTNVRLPEKLRQMIQTEAKLHDWSFNRELVQRLQRSFYDQGVEALIQKAALETAEQVGAKIGNLMQAYNLEITRANERLTHVEHVQRLQEIIINKGDDNG